MKNKLLAVGLLVLSAHATAGSDDIVASNNRILVQAIATEVNYQEFGNGYLGTPTGLLDTETGPVMGMGVSVSGMRGAGNFYWEGYLDYSAGQTRYTGALRGGAFGSYVGVSSATLTNYGVRGGKGIPVQEGLMLTPYLELGHHEWDRGVNYGELYSHEFYGVGLMGQYSPLSRVVYSISVLFGRTSQSYIEVSSGPQLTGFAGRLGNSALSRFGVAADYAFNPGLHGNIAVDYMTFQYGMSAAYPVGGGLVVWEPDSKTRYIVLKVGLAATF